MLYNDVNNNNKSYQGIIKSTSKSCQLVKLLVLFFVPNQCNWDMHITQCYIDNILSDPTWMLPFVLFPLQILRRH